MKQNTFAVSGEGALPCDAKGLWKPRYAVAHARRRRSSQTEQSWRDSAVPGKTSKDKGQAILRDNRRVHTQFSDRNFTARLRRSLWVSSLCPE